MKQLIAVFIFTIICSTIEAQLESKEHLSHDKLSRSHLGFIFQENEIVLVLDNHNWPSFTVEKIDQNNEKEEIYGFSHSYKSKSVLTGIDSKKILMVEPWDLDAQGYGAISLRLKNDELGIVNLSSYGNNYHCVDAIIPETNFTNAECFTDMNQHLILDSVGNIIESYDHDNPIVFHEGLAHNYRIQGGGLYLHDKNETTYLFDVPEIKGIYNNPFTQELLVHTDTTLTSYDITNHTISKEFIFEHEPIALDFADDAMYYIAKRGSGYRIYKNYYFGGSNQWMDIDHAPSGQEIDIKAIEIRGIDAYLFGIHHDKYTKTNHHVVQKVNLLAPQNPPRRDLAIQSFTLSSEDAGDGYINYTYKIEVINKSSVAVSNFNIYSELTEFNELFYTWVNESFEGEFLPGEVLTFEGTINTTQVFTKMNISIPGSDYMFDSFPNDNHATANLLTSATDDITKMFSMNPNPTTGYLSLDLDNLNNVHIVVFDIYGRPLMTFDKPIVEIDLSNLADGQYFLQVRSENNIITRPILKI